MIAGNHGVAIGEAGGVVDVRRSVGMEWEIVRFDGRLLRLRLHQWRPHGEAGGVVDVRRSVGMEWEIVPRAQVQGVALVVVEEGEPVATPCTWARGTISHSIPTLRRTSTTPPA